MSVSEAAERLWQAIEQNDLEKVKAVLDQPGVERGFVKDVCQAEVNTIVFGKKGDHRDRVSCLHLAAKRGQEDILTHILSVSCAIDVDATSSLLGWTPLHYATNGGHKHAIKILLKAGANKSAVVKDGRCPIHLAISKGFRRIAGYLAAQDCDVNIQDKNGNTPLHYCLDDKVLAKTGWTGKQRYEMVELLLIKGAYGALKNAAKESPLHWAVQYSVEPETVQILIQAMEHISEGVDIVNSQNQSPLHLAKDPLTVEALISYGASVNLASSNGMTPLHYQVNSPEAIEILLHQGAKVTCKDKQGRTALHMAVACDVPNLWTVRMLSGDVSCVNMQDNNLETPLHLACQTNYTSVCTIDDHQRNVMVAFEPGQDPILEILLRHGAQLNIQNKKKQTPLLKALEKRLYEKANILYVASDGAELDIPDQYGRTAKTLAPNWYSSLQKLDSSVLQMPGKMKALEVLTEEEEQSNQSSTEAICRKKGTVAPFSVDDQTTSQNTPEYVTTKGQTRLVAFPAWIKGEENERSVRSKFGRAPPAQLPRSLTELPAWVLEPEERTGSSLSMCGSDASTSAAPYTGMPRADTSSQQAGTSQTGENAIREDEDALAGSLTRQVTSLQGEMKDFTSFLEEFAEEGSGEKQDPLKDTDVDQDFVSLQEDVKNVRLFLEKFSEENI